MLTTFIAGRRRLNENSGNRDVVEIEIINEPTAATNVAAVASVSRTTTRWLPSRRSDTSDRIRPDYNEYLNMSRNTTQKGRYR